jgi:hypothetical protein
MDFKEEIEMLEAELLKKDGEPRKDADAEKLERLKALRGLLPGEPEPEKEKGPTAPEVEKAAKEKALSDIKKIYVHLSREQKKIEDFHQKAADRLHLLEARISRYHNPKTGGHVPIEQFRQWRAEHKALRTGAWVPGWKLPKKMTAYDKFMNE